ncbi:Pectate lyase superfamily protein [Aquisphaera giovannonii]|uniref:Pectate lyase superfamily protein n=1 Tax=Aquisphaera giovannonii TaxID=406548 RepID=A0A5B9WEK8_9BACT|nr:right-handed parallel beta-helix repeat-containing protein [Aquisphaera giovannonii]QEH38320.1 Pectate lyase superfamily protein [Aquisphaera giovannonii]
MSGRGPARAVGMIAAAALAMMAGAAAGGGTGRAEIRVGVRDGDIRGEDNRAIQAAVDHVSSLGGGTVRVGEGRYAMRNALRLRDGVRVVGVPGATILAACDGAETPLACDGDCNERQVTLGDPSAFRVGDGVSIQDQDCGAGFMVTTATLTARLDDRTFAISTPLYLDYMVSKKATARLASPVVGGWGVHDAAVEGLTIEGNRARRGKLDGCRGGGIYLFECRDVAIRGCVVRGYNGDGISFQVSTGVVVEGCTAEGNAGLGIHPGSGSQGPIVRDNRSIGNGGDGLFVCWRVKHGVFERNELRGNGGAGVSIGHKDTDNLFRGNSILGNGGAGILFRDELEAMGAHRNVFEGNRILDNGGSSANDTPAGIRIKGTHRDLVFRGNTIGSSREGTPKGVGILRGEGATGLRSEENRFQNVAREIETER